jgi:gluconokinase
MTGTVVVLVGVSGAGKTTVGRALAQALQFPFYEGDDYHSPTNRAKIHAGVALTDADRDPWLKAIRTLIDNVLAGQGDAVIACSALKRAYRDALRQPGVLFVYLKVPVAELRTRLENRTGHFAGPALLDSQLQTLEEPRHAILIEADRSVDEIVADIVRQMPSRADVPE